MANKSEGKASVNLKASISVDSVDGDLYEFNDASAPLIQNTGVFKQGGLTNLNEVEVLFAPGSDHGYTDSGQLITATPGSGNLLQITADGKAIGTTSSLGVSKNLEITGYDDVLLTDDGTYITLKLVSNVVTVTEFNMSQVQLNTKSTTFTGIAAFLQLISSIGFVRYNGVNYSDSLEFSLRLGDQVVILKESTPGQSVVTSLASTTVLGAGNAIRCSLVLNGVLIVAGDNGRVGSFDGSAWKNYDGTGTGTGVYNSGTVMGNNRINAIAAFGNGFAVAGVGGRLGSWDGSAWKNYDATGDGLGPSDNGTLIGSNDINAMVVWNTTFLVVGGVGGRMGSLEGATKYVYTRTQTTVITGRNYPAPTSNATLIGANDIKAMAIYSSGTERVIVVAGVGGLVASWDWGWTNSSATSAPVNSASTWVSNATGPPSNVQARIAYGNGLWVSAITGAAQTSGIQTSPDGITWTVRTTPASGGSASWRDIFFGNGLFVCTQNGTGATTLITSPDGITWTARSIGTTSIAAGVYADTLGLYVVVSSAAGTDRVWTSPDAITWTQRTTGSLTPVGIAWGNSTLVVTGGGTWLTSTNGTTWTTRTGTGPTGRVTFGGGTFVAFSGTANGASGSSYTSTDNGVSWVARTPPASASPSGAAWIDLAFLNGLFVMVNGGISTTAAVITSPDGITWTQQTTPSVPASGWASIAAGGDGRGRFMMMSSGTAPYSAMQSLPNNPVPISNNATAVSTDAVTSILTDTSLIVIGGSLGKIASYNGTSWNNYNSGSGFSNNAVAVGANQVNAIVKFGSTYVFGAATGKLASWDGTNWKNADGTGTGTGVYNNQTVIGAVDITALGVLNSLLWIGSAGGAENSMTSAGVFVPLYTIPSGVVANLLSGMTGVGYLYVYRYLNGQYLVDLVGNNLNIIWTLDNSTLALTQLAGQYAWPQVSNGFTRHIITGTPTVVSADVQAISLTGYTAFTSTFVAGQTFTASGISVASIPLAQVGFNYADALLVPTGEATHRVNFYAPPPTVTPSTLQRISRGNTTTLINGYGKLTNAYGVASSAGFEFRVGWVSAGNNTGVQSYLSAAVIDSQATDAMGTVLTVIGEFDGLYTPNIGPNEDTVLYGAGAFFRIITVSTDVPDRIQRLNGRFTKINSISPLNLYDSDTQSLMISSMDYNGRSFWTYTGTPASEDALTVSLIQYPGNVPFPFSSSIDTGERLVSFTPSASTVLPFGYRIPLSNQIYPGFHVDTYAGGDYSFSTFNNGSTGVLEDPAFPIYAPVTLLPVPIGSEYAEGTATTFDETLFLFPNFDGYLAGNSSANNASVSAVGRFDTFLLYGQIYLFDGVQVYLATITDNVLTTITAMTYAQGMIYLSTSPTEAFFLSTWDNSVYSYDGGRALTKVKTFTNVPDILSAKYSTYDNALLLDASTELVWFRDGVISSNPKKTAQLATMRLWSTANGIYVVNTEGSWRYVYAPLSGSTIVPLSIQTGYFGQGKNEVSIYRGWVFKLYVPNRLGFSVTITEHTKDQAKEYTNVQTFRVATKDIDSNGYYYLRIQPKYERGLQQSFELEFTTNIVLLETDLMVDDSVGAIPASSK